MMIFSNYEENLTSRYMKLYGRDDCSEMVIKEKKKLLIQVSLAVLIFAVVTINDISVSRSEYSNVITNNKGEITGFVRPGANEESYSFTTKVKVISEEGEREKEYYITVEPAGDSASETVLEPDAEIPEEERADAELKRLISALNEDTRDLNVELPDKLDTGEKLIWQKTENSDPVIYFAGLIVGVFLIYRNRFYAIKKEEKQAKESIIRELPDFINKLVLLINAGVILNTAFLKIADDCDEKKINTSYFYRRIAGISHMVRETNASFHNEMYIFAKNSGVKELMRITNIMLDNVSKGDDLSSKLKRENELLWFARKQQAEEKGKLAETKLTLPLMLLLTVLIVITISPALMEI